MSTAVQLVNGEGRRSDRTTTQPAGEHARQSLAPVCQEGRRNGHEGIGMKGEDQAPTLTAAHTCLLRASEALHTLLQACVRARAAIENVPEPENLNGAVEELGVSHRAADAAVRAARQRIEIAAAVDGERGGA